MRERKASIEVGEARLTARLAAAGRDPTNTYMRATFTAEVAARDAALAARAPWT